ncbi:Nucleoside diphosphate-linked moiety X motif 19, mitochondrial [Trachymyrmex zeteki]|uniref:Nucleoside diphosphate-linked moiety X motif 19, mitochondrial n=2 Tax=Mycetomoellerius zeteki TaxID=64791 RepID=A0A151WYH1_9HYME|nr:Nucleoside diphosphate-linked moiety X motif 19, mitochondrial [Trachymyrmex zeteki]
MPGLYVFPGGAVDPTDSNLKWYEHFSAFGLDKDKLASLVPKTVSRPQIFQSKENELLKEISLRITAIRETFEECGILICRRNKDGDAHSGWAEHVSIPEGELQMWKNKVHNDATEFLNLCQKLECYPDLWALHEWSNWLTPTYRFKTRFDTAFYLVCMPHMPHAEYEAIEMEDLQWFSPEKLLSTNVEFPPPQQYEIAKFTKVKSIDNLLDIAMERNKIGVQLYLSVTVQLKDGIVFLLPEDTMYPNVKEIELFEQQLIDKSDITAHEFEKMTLIKNRIVILDTQVNIIFTDNGKDNCVIFLKPGYHSKSGNVESKNKL